MIRILLSALLSAVMLSSCAKPVELASNFEKMSGHFVNAMRWQDFQGAAKFLVEDQREAFLQQFPRSKDLHVVDARFERIARNEEAGEAETVLFIEYYLLPSVTITEWSWTQQWQRMDGSFTQEDIWLIQTSPPVFP
jgi:hypothetical protein